MTKKTNNYKDSGVNVQEGQDFINDIKDELNDLQNNFAIGSIGGFSGYILILPKIIKIQSMLWRVTGLAQS